MTRDYKLEISFAGFFFCIYVFLALFNASEYFVYFSIVFGLFGLIFAWKIFENIDDQPEGDEKMMEIAETIHDGSMVFLSRKYRVLFYFISGFSLALLVVFGLLQGIWIGLCTAVAFLMGAVSSLMVGFFGVNAGASASVRTAQAALEGERNKALDIAFNGGSVMGVCVASLGLAGIGLLFLIFARGDSAFVINGFALGASSMALISRFAGNIFSNAAEISCGQPEGLATDFPKGTAEKLGALTANIGRNLRGVGLSAELFESYVCAIIAAIAIGATSARIPQALRFDYMALPLLICMAGLIVTIACIRAIPLFEPTGAKVFRHSTLIGAGAMSIAALFAIKIMGLSSSLFVALFFGCLAGAAGGWITEYSGKFFPKTATPRNDGLTTQRIAWWSSALESALIPIVLIAITVFFAGKSAGLYGVALAAVGLLGTVGIISSINAQGYVAGNANGIAQIAGMGPEPRKIIDDIEVCDDKTGFMVAATIVTALALFGAYVEAAHIKEIDIINADMLVGFFLGACLPFLIASLVMKSLGRLATLLKGETGCWVGSPDTTSHINHGALATIKETIAPGFIVLVMPVFVSLALGRQGLGAMLLGCILLGIGLILLLSNDGIWDSTKYFTGNAEELGDSCHAVNPLKDTCVPAINILIKAVAIVSLVLSSLFV